MSACGASPGAWRFLELRRSELGDGKFSADFHYSKQTMQDGSYSARAVLRRDVTHL